MLRGPFEVYSLGLPYRGGALRELPNPLVESNGWDRTPGCDAPRPSPATCSSQGHCLDRGLDASLDLELSLGPLSEAHPFWATPVLARMNILTEASTRQSNNR